MANSTDPNNRTTMKNTITYEVQDKIVSQRLVMRDSFGLYLVLAIQPILTLACFLVCTLLYASQLDSGFSMIALLAGVNSKSLRWLKGAALSGNLSRAVQVRISIVPRSGRDAVGYVLDGDELAKDLVYTLDKEPLPVKSGKHVGPRPRQMLY